MWRVIIIVLLLTACTTTKEALIPCEELDRSLFNEAHDLFIIESCITGIRSKCHEDDTNCTKAQYITCFEQYYRLKKKQFQDFRTQQCWMFHVEQY